MRLHVRVVGAEEARRAVAGEVLDLVDDLAATVVALPGHALGVLVVEPGAERLEHRDGREVLRGDQLEGLLLTLQLEVEECRDLGVGGAQRRLFDEIPRARGGAWMDVDRCAGHSDLCPSVLTDGRSPNSEVNTPAGIGPSRSTRGLVVVQSMIVEARPAERPPSRTASISPSSAAATSAAVAAGASPWRFALVVASGPVARSSSSASAWSGTRTLSVSPARGIAQRRRRSLLTIDSGPGQ